MNPIHDVAPPRDSLGNPEHLANIPVRQAPNQTQSAQNPISASDAQKDPEPHQEAKKDDMDKVLKDVNKEVKATSQKPWQPSKPVLEITLAIFVAVALSAAAVFAFR